MSARERSTSLPGDTDTPASRFLSPGSDWARRMTAHSGRRCEASLTLSGPLSSLARMYLGTSRWASTVCYLTWKRSVTPAGRPLFRLSPSMPRTAATGSGSSPIWNTPTANDARQGANGTSQSASPSLTAQVLYPTPTASDRPNEGNVRLYRQKIEAGEMTEADAEALLGKSPWDSQGKIPALLPTPTASDGDRTSDSYARGNLTLGGAARLWPTPTVHGNNNRHDLPTANGDGLSTAVKRTAGQLWPTPVASENANQETTVKASMLDGRHGASLAGAAHLAEGSAGTGRKLSADWVEALMGYPPGWTDLTGAGDQDGRMDSAA